VYHTSDHLFRKAGIKRLTWSQLVVERTRLVQRFGR